MEWTEGPSVLERGVPKGRELLPGGLSEDRVFEQRPQ